MKSSDHFLRPRAIPALGLWAVAIALLVASAALAHLDLQQARLNEALSAQQQALEAGQRHVARTKPVTGDMEKQRHWATLRAERNFPWNQVFDAVERADRDNIELLEFRPEKANRSIILRGEALDTEALSAYLEALVSQPSLKLTHLLHLQSMKREKFGTVAFEIKATIR